MKISVIVPIYNVEGYLNKCIESIINQSYKDLEIILVDDGSTDNSSAICDRYAEVDMRIINIHKSNSGVVSARKTGGQIASGEYIVSVDGDDWIDEDYIENFVEFIEREKREVIWSISYYKQRGCYSELCLANVKGDILSKGVQRELLNLVCGEYGFQNDIEYSICNKCIKRDLYNLVQGKVDDSLTRGEDLYFSIALLTNTDSIFFCRNDGYHYVQRETSNTNNKTAYTNEKFLILQEKLKEFSSALKEKKKSLNHIIDGYLLSTYMLYFFGTVQDREYLYPFTEIEKGSRIVIYGGGSIGKNIISYLENLADYNIVAWVDSRMVDQKIGKWVVKSASEIVNLQYDFIILATNRTKYIEEMKENLKRLEIKDEKVVSAFGHKNH
ncbi:MAG: glycosyltransferase [Lachnospiraceae bacterium]|nr:glycosyltransferase [Lachnospiraceae bacterium]